MFKIILTAIILFTLALLFYAAGQIPGTLSLNYAGTYYEVSLASGLFVLAVFIFLLFVLLRSFYLLKRLYDRRDAAYREKTLKRGFSDLTTGLSALSAGDTQKAKKIAQKLKTKIGAAQGLALFIEAQAARLEQDEKAVKTHYLAMLDNKQARFIAMRGLIQQAIRQGDREEARALLRLAQQQSPAASWVTEALFRLDVAARDWDAAQTLIEGKAKRLDMTHKQAMKAALYTQQSFDANDNAEEALAAAQDALRADPRFIPAYLAKARALKMQGRDKHALKALAKAYKQDAHPLIARDYIALFCAQDGKSEQQAIEALYRYNPKASLEESPPLKEVWLCYECQNEAKDWSAVCNHCEGFNTLRWGKDHAKPFTEQLEKRLLTDFHTLGV